MRGRVSPETARPRTDRKRASFASANTRWRIRAPGTPDPFAAYFGLKEDLEQILGRRVDLVMAEAVRNPHFAASALAGAVELYAA